LEFLIPVKVKVEIKSTVQKNFCLVEIKFSDDESNFKLQVANKIDSFLFDTQKNNIYDFNSRKSYPYKPYPSVKFLKVINDSIFQVKYRDITIITNKTENSQVYPFPLFYEVTSCSILNFKSLKTRLQLKSSMHLSAGIEDVIRRSSAFEIANEEYKFGF